MWTIFFHRLFGPVVPGTNNFFDISYPYAEGQLELDSLIDERIDQLIRRKIDSDTNASEPANAERRGQLIVQFLDKKEKIKKKSGWFGQGRNDMESMTLWESWIINVKCLPFDKDKALNKEESEDNDANSKQSYNIELSIESFETNLGKIIELVDSHKDHIPPITSLESSPFPYSINIERNIPTSGLPQGEESWGKYIKKMLD